MKYEGMKISSEAIEPHRNFYQEIQNRMMAAFIEKEILALAEFTGIEFARHVYEYPISFYYTPGEEDTYGQ